MPAILWHIAFAEKVYRSLPSNINIDKGMFIAGNLIPDLAISKEDSHFRKTASIAGLFVPDMERVEKLYTLENSLYLGMYTHLYLDHKFIEGFLIPSFIWDYENMRIINPRNSLEWDAKTFFSQDGMYGSYSELNHLLLRDEHVSIKELSKIPEFLPFTGLPAFDKRRQKTWKAEFKEYMLIKKAYTGNLFDYEQMWAFVELCSEEFIMKLMQPTKLLA